MLKRITEPVVRGRVAELRDICQEVAEFYAGEIVRLQSAGERRHDLLRDILGYFGVCSYVAQRLVASVNRSGGFLLPAPQGVKCIPL